MTDERRGKEHNPHGRRSSDDDTYNGWSNYETWAVNLWLTNERDTYDELHERARQAIADAQDEPADLARLLREARVTVLESAARELATSLQSWVADMLPELGASLAADLLNAAMGEVDWREIAENIIDEEAQEAIRRG